MTAIVTDVHYRMFPAAICDLAQKQKRMDNLTGFRISTL